MVQNKTYTYYRIQAVHSLGSEKEGFEIIMLGDSITEGGNWEQLLNGADVANYGIGGNIAINPLCSQRCNNA